MIACGGFAAVGVLLFIGGIREWQIESASVNWPAAEAEITRAEMVKNFSLPPRSGTAFAESVRQVSVRYAANSKEYTTEFKLPASVISVPTPSPRQGFFSNKTSTERVVVYYNPDNPREVILNPGHETTAIYGMTFGSILAAIFSMLIFVLAPKLFKPLANG
jgi:Protein of unknown function (DUF3592)